MGEEELSVAAKWIASADAILICSGSGATAAPLQLPGGMVYHSAKDFAKSYPWLVTRFGEGFSGSCFANELLCLKYMSYACFGYRNYIAVPALCTIPSQKRLVADAHFKTCRQYHLITSYLLCKW